MVTNTILPWDSEALAIWRGTRGARGATQSCIHSDSSCISDCILRINTSSSHFLPPLKAGLVGLLEEVHDGVRIRVEREGHEEGVQEVQAKVAHFHQPLQQALQVPTVHLRG